MVSPPSPGPLDRMLERILSFRLVKKGAESEIRLGSYAGIKAIFKVRRRKRYMHPKLDERLRSLRTKREAQTLIRSYDAGAKVPRILAIYPSIGVLVLEYIEGPTLKELLSERGLEEGLLREAGRILGLVHRAGVVHGDPTTSNYIVSPKGLYLVDFGLAELSREIEDRAVDVHLFRRALESTHAGIYKESFEAFKEGYLEVLGEEGLAVIKRAEEIRLRGRYVEARRRSIWRSVGEDEV